MEDLFCLRCKTEMDHLGTEQIQLGQTGWILGDLPNLLAGAMELSIYGCPHCGKIEFFQPHPQASENTGSQEEFPGLKRLISKWFRK
jgi:hypothetical protein